jgi:hypothetical protein
MNAEVHQEIVKCNKWVDEHTDSVWELRDSSQKFIQSQTDKLVFGLYDNFQWFSHKKFMANVEQGIRNAVVYGFFLGRNYKDIPDNLKNELEQILNNNAKED